MAEEDLPAEEEQESPALLDEAKSQNAADTQVLISAIGQARLELAEMKLAYYAAVGGFVSLDGTGTPFDRGNRLQREIEKKRKFVDFLMKLLEHVYPDSTIAEPSPLAVLKK